MSKSTMASSNNDWQAQSDMRTLVEAQQIRNDAKRFKAATAKAAEQSAAHEAAFSAPGGVAAPAAKTVPTVKPAAKPAGGMPIGIVSRNNK